MANALYDLGRQAFLDGDLDWAANNIKVLLIDTGAYTVNLATDQFHAIIPGAAIIATSANLAGKTSTAGVADANDVTFTAVAGVSVVALVIYQDAGASATSSLIAYIDTANGLPVAMTCRTSSLSMTHVANCILKR